MKIWFICGILIYIIPFADLILKVLGKNMTKFPKISINDAFIGCVMFLSKSFNNKILYYISFIKNIIRFLLRWI